MAKHPVDSLRAIAPKLAEINDRLIYEDIWARPELSARDRSLITIAALVAMSRPVSLVPHIKRGLKNGLTRTEISEVITHLAFYSGWPAAVVASQAAEEAFED